MGVPISGKNLFPSNIAGLPTWFTIRANKDGYIARKKEIDLLIAMNAETAQEDVKTLAAGAAVLYDQPLALDKVRDDLIFYAVPYDKLVAAVCPEAKLRKLIKNMIYVGVAAQLLEIDFAEVEKSIRKQFATKAKAATLNLAAAKGRPRLFRGQFEEGAIRSTSHAWTRRKARSSSTAIPPLPWDACLPVARWSLGIRSRLRRHWSRR